MADEVTKQYETLRYAASCRRVLILLGLAAMCCGCSPWSRLERASTEELMRDFQAAVDDAEEAKVDEISQQLDAVIPSNNSLLWRDDTGHELLVVTWTNWSGYDEQVGKEMAVGRDVWVTVVPRLRDFCRDLPGRKPTVVARRLEQLLGLPPDDGRDRFVEMWVEPSELLRPCADPEISDRECEVEFPTSAYSTVNPHYEKWFKTMVGTMYGEGGYPWTRLGYTYDWGARGDQKFGLSEFIVRKGAQIQVTAVHDAHDYCHVRPRRSRSAQTGKGKQP